MGNRASKVGIVDDLQQKEREETAAKQQQQQEQQQEEARIRAEAAAAEARRLQLLEVCLDNCIFNWLCFVFDSYCLWLVKTS